MKRPPLPMIASCLLLAYGAAATWADRLCRLNLAAAPSWCQHWLCDEEQLAQTAYPQLWEGQAGRAAALATFEQVLARDPASGRRWCDLGETLLELDEIQRARYCFTQAMERAPHSPMISLRSANFYFRTGETEKALQQMSYVLRSVDTYDEVVFSAYSRFVGDIQKTLNYGIPVDRRAAHSYFRYLLAQKHLEETRAAWGWISARSLATDPLADQYIAALMKDGAIEEAAETWSTYLGARRNGYRETNYLFNGGFESEPSGCELDWAVEAVPSVEVERDREVMHDGAASLRIRFDGSENINYHNVWQTVVAAPGQYRLEAWLRTSEISTDQGIGLHIFDPREPNQVDAKTVVLTGTAGWTQVEATVHVPNKTRLMLVQVMRPSSRRLDSKIRGTAWIDGVTLRRLD